MSYTRELIERVLHYAEDTQAMIDIIEELLEENDALREDAERYREIKVGQNFSVVDFCGDHLRMHLLDAAIDAARNKG